MKAKYIGLILLVVVIALAGGYSYLQSQQQEQAVVSGYIGGEKIGFVENPQVQKILKDKYALTLHYQKAGSFDMITLPHDGRDYLWPSSQTALDLYERTYGKPKQAEIIFNTPIVLYTRRLVSDALVREGYLSEQNGVYYMDMQQFLPVLENETKWADIGVSELYGTVLVATTDPTKSNSGNMFAGLIANMLNGGEVVGGATVEGILPRLTGIFRRLGYMETSSADLFSQFLKTGVGAKPIVAGYESQLIEFSDTNPNDFDKLKDDVVIIYPVPTVWSSHVYIALDDTGKRAVPALMDEQLQRIAWEQHGFRTGVNASGDAAAGLKVQGVAPVVSKIIQMPDSTTMARIINALTP